jgi:hypothetical protein
MATCIDTLYRRAIGRHKGKRVAERLQNENVVPDVEVARFSG